MVKLFIQYCSCHCISELHPTTTRSVARACPIHGGGRPGHRLGNCHKGSRNMGTIVSLMCYCVHCHEGFIMRKVHDMHACKLLTLWLMFVPPSNVFKCHVSRPRELGATEDGLTNYYF